MMPMNRILLFFSFFLSVVAAKGSDSLFVCDMRDGMLQMRQKPGTNRLLADYLKGVKSHSDTIYAIFYVPANCRRCEITIPTLYSLLKKVDRRKELLLVSIYRNAEMAAHYNKEKGYKADHYLYDTTDSYQNIFSLNLDDLQDCFVLKICKSKGQTLLAGPPTEVSDDFAKALVAFKGCQPMYDFDDVGPKDAESSPRPSSLIKPLTAYTDHRMQIDKRLPPSVVYQGAVYQDSVLLFNDQIHNGVMVFKEKRNHLAYQGLLRVNDDEKNRYAKIPKANFEAMKNSGQLFYMPIAPSLSADGEAIEISYSIPDLSLMKTPEGDTAVAYYNAGVSVRRRVGDLRADSLLSIDLDPHDANYFYAHFKMRSFYDKAIVRCQKKGWPIEMPLKTYKGNPDKDPFMKDFYRRDNPFMAVADRKTGRIRYHFGQLADYAEKGRFGYCFTDPVYDINKSEVAYSDGYSGAILVGDSTNLRLPKEKYVLFTIDADSFPTPDTSRFYKEEYRKAYNRFFYRKIEKLVVTDDFMGCIIRYGKNQTKDRQLTDPRVFALADRHTGIITQWLLPRPEKAEVMDYGLKKSFDQSITPFVMYKKGNHYNVRMFDISGQKSVLSEP